MCSYFTTCVLCMEYWAFEITGYKSKYCIVFDVIWEDQKNKAHSVQLKYHKIKVVSIEVIENQHDKSIMAC